MGQRRWSSESHPETLATNAEDHRLVSKADKKSKKEREDDKKLQRNAQRRERRLREKLKEAEELSRARFEEGVEEGARIAGEQYEGKVEKLESRVHGMKKTIARHDARDRREPSRVDHAVQRALRHSQNPDPPTTITRYVKGKRNVVQDWARNAIVTLVNQGVAISNTWPVFKANADSLGVVIVGKWSTRTSGRVVREGGIAAGLMITEYILKCISMTMSGDGTTHKNIQFSSRHAAVIPPDGNPPKDVFLGITPEVNHTTDTQFEGWKLTIRHLCDVYNGSPMGKVVRAEPARIWERLRGYLSDHASDQKKLAGFLQGFRRDCDRELRGEAAMISGDYKNEWDRVFKEKGREMMEEVGGPEHYLTLSIAEQLEFTKRLIREAQILLGEQVYQQLSPEEKAEIDYWVWSGCAMHKELNAMKGGADRMAKRWKEFDDGMLPIALMNKFKAVAANSGTVPEEALERAGDRGGVKLTDLLGSLVKHRETKKGHQDRFRAFSIHFLGTSQPIQFAETNKSRYQSHGYAATEILHHLDLYLAFLLSVADTKALDHELNHLEQNVQAGLNDPPTLTELSVMSLYSQAISVPFSQHIRNPSLNGLDLGPDYHRIKQHLVSVIENPELLLGQTASHEVGTLYGEQWSNEDVVKYIRTNQNSLPHLREILIAFFQGALETWQNFTQDICDDPKVTGATPEQRRLAFRHSANDLNEGALGVLRREYRAFPKITFNMVNMKLMSRLNPGTVDYMSNLPPEGRSHLRGMARDQDESKAYRGFLLSQAEEDAKTAKEKRAKAEKRKQNVADRAAKLNAFKPILSLKKLKAMKVGGDRADRIKDQLTWHKKIGGDASIPKNFHKFRKGKAWVVMIKAVERHLRGVAHLKVDEEPNEDDDPFAGVEIASDEGGFSNEYEGGNDGEDEGGEDGNDEEGNNSIDDEGNDGDVNDDEGNYSASIQPTFDPDILLDSAASSDNETTGLSDIDADSQDEGAGSSSGDAMDVEEEGDEGLLEFDNWFDGVELGIIPPIPTPRTEDQQPQRYIAGCKWDSEDYSCPYDAYLMCFWSLYEQSSATWRNEWIRHSENWNIPLSNNFDHLILLTDSPTNTRDLTAWFSHYRNSLRKQLSDADPRSFPRNGPVLASASRILGVTFGRITGPYLEQNLTCSECGMSTMAQIDTRYVMHGRGRDRRTASLQVVWEQFVERHSESPFGQQAKCDCCEGQNRVEGLRMPETPWIWFERQRRSPVEPSPSLTFNSPSQQLRYSLQSAIYTGERHFTARFRDQSGAWWKHDGKIASGVPQLDDIQSGAELLSNDDKFACIFVYRRDYD